MLSQSLEVMLYGLTGVFSALAILFVVVKILGKMFPGKPNNEK